MAYSLASSGRPSDVHETFPDVVSELVANAVEHGSDDGNDESEGDGDDGNARVHVDVSVGRRDDALVELVVADDGPGIPEADRRIIEREQTATQLSHASGVGLWLVDWIVDISGGTLAIEDRDSGGARVRGTVPATASDE